MGNAEIDYSVGGWKINDRAEHVPTGVGGRVVGLFVGLRDAQLQIEYVNSTGTVIEDWFMVGECEEVAQ